MSKSKVSKRIIGVSGRTPNGKELTGRKYFDAWKKYSKQVEEVTGCTVYGFDPSISLVSKEHPAHTIQLPIWFCDQIIKNFKERKD